MLKEFVFPQDGVGDAIPDKYQRAGGLEMRDYFAAQALPMMVTITTGTDIENAMLKAALMAYKAADAMLKARVPNAG